MRRCGPSWLNSCARHVHDGIQSCIQTLLTWLQSHLLLNIILTITSMQMGMGDLEPAYQSFQPEGALQPSHSRFVIKGVRHSSSLGMWQQQKMIIHALAYERSNLKQMGNHVCMRCRKQQSKYEEISQSIARTTCAGSGRIAPHFWSSQSTLLYLFLRLYLPTGCLSHSDHSITTILTSSIVFFYPGRDAKAGVRYSSTGMSLNKRSRNLCKNKHRNATVSPFTRQVIKRAKTQGKFDDGLCADE